MNLFVPQSFPVLVGNRYVQHMGDNYHGSPNLQYHVISALKISSYPMLFSLAVAAALKQRNS